VGRLAPGAQFSGIRYERAEAQRSEAIAVRAILVIPLRIDPTLWFRGRGTRWLAASFNLFFTKVVFYSNALLELLELPAVLSLRRFASLYAVQGFTASRRALDTGWVR